jgi:hypothetical protein
MARELVVPWSKARMYCVIRVPPLQPAGQKPMVPMVASIVAGCNNQKNARLAPR